METGTARGARRPRPNPNRERYAAIGQELRRVFESVMNEPVPDELLALLQEVDPAERNAAERSGEARNA